MHSSWQDLARVPFFAHLHRIMALDLNRNFDFCSTSRKQTDIFSLIFRTFVLESQPVIYAKISFPFNILRTNGQNFTKFYLYIHIDKIYFGNIKLHFLHICTRVMALDLLQNFISAQYLENKWTEFHQILYMHSC